MTTRPSSGSAASKNKNNKKKIDNDDDLLNLDDDLDRILREQAEDHSYEWVDTNSYPNSANMGKTSSQNQNQNQNRFSTSNRPSSGSVASATSSRSNLGLDPIETKSSSSSSSSSTMRKATSTLDLAPSPSPSNSSFSSAPSTPASTSSSSKNNNNNNNKNNNNNNIPLAPSKVQAMKPNAKPISLEDLSEHVDALQSYKMRIERSVDQIGTNPTTADGKPKSGGKDTIESRMRLAKDLQESLALAEQVSDSLAVTSRSSFTGKDEIFFTKLVSAFRDLDRQLKSLHKSADAKQAKNPLFFSIDLKDFLEGGEEFLQSFRKPAPGTEQMLLEDAMKNLENLGFKPLSQDEIERMDREEDEQIEKIQSEFMQVSEMFQLLGHHVDMQQEQLNHIERNVERAQGQVKHANRNLKKAAVLAAVGGVLGLTIVGVVGGAVIVATGGIAAAAIPAAAGVITGTAAIATAVTLGAVAGLGVGAVTGGVAGAGVGMVRKKIMQKINDPDRPFKPKYPKQGDRLIHGDIVSGKVGWGRTFYFDIPEQGYNKAMKIILEVNSDESSKDVVVKVWNNERQQLLIAEKYAPKKWAVILCNVATINIDDDEGINPDTLFPGRYFVEIKGLELIKTTYFTLKFRTGEARKLTLRNYDEAVEILYENERRLSLVTPYSASFLMPKERGNWSDELGKTMPRKEEIELPDDDKWRWTSDWQVAIDPNATDQNGWSYAFNFNSSEWSPESGGLCRVRRRKWLRKRMAKPSSSSSKKSSVSSSSSSSSGTKGNSFDDRLEFADDLDDDVRIRPVSSHSSRSTRSNSSAPSYNSNNNNNNNNEPKVRRQRTAAKGADQSI